MGKRFDWESHRNLGWAGLDDEDLPFRVFAEPTCDNCSSVSASALWEFCQDRSLQGSGKERTSYSSSPKVMALRPFYRQTREKLSPRLEDWSVREARYSTKIKTVACLFTTSNFSPVGVVDEKILSEKNDGQLSHALLGAISQETTLKRVVETMRWDRRSRLR
jgi:hypothetical protein